MKIAKIVKQVIAETENRIGMLAEVTGTLAIAGVNILAICAYGMQGKATFMLIADNSRKAASGLKSKGYKVSEEDVVLVNLANKRGTAAKMAKKLKDAGINLHYIYGTTSSASKAPVVFTSNDNAKALTVLNKK